MHNLQLGRAPGRDSGQLGAAMKVAEPSEFGPLRSQPCSWAPQTQVSGPPASGQSRGPVGGGRDGDLSHPSGLTLLDPWLFETPSPPGHMGVTHPPEFQAFLHDRV